MSSNRITVHRFSFDRGNYFNTVDLLEITDHQKNFIKRIINSYVLFCGDSVDLNHTLEYLAMVKETKDLTTYNKEYYAIKKYLKFIHCDFLDQIPETKNKYYTPKELTLEKMQPILDKFKDDKQMVTILKLGSISFCRAYELYALTFEDFNFQERSISINRNNDKTTKNLMSIRKTYFNESVSLLVQDYFKWCKLHGIKKPFSMLTIGHKLKGTGFQIKMLRHISVRTASLRNMNFQILQRLCGWSSGIINHHYLWISDQEIKTEYDRVFNPKVA
ncbi:MAG: hypothetical protein IMZ53_06990 [Thermoplasmata archaeon]|nr:hypothetical protein [Thermoplasmata archaeon]MBE3140310.1 hypothetical protein [Thermoplasmata archaeon]